MISYIGYKIHGKNLQELKDVSTAHSGHSLQPNG